MYARVKDNVNNRNATVDIVLELSMQYLHS